MGSGLRLLVGASVFTLALASTAAAAAPPAPSALGTWKLNVAKSSFTPGPGWRSQVRTYSLEPGGGVLIIWTGVGGHGEPMHVRFISRLDGKDYPMTGSANYDALNAVPVDAFTVKSEEKRGGEVAGVAMRTLSADGKVMTITDEGTDRKGEKFSQVLVFERE
jgi:hypothetical protein